MIKVKDNPDLVRDAESKAILACDSVKLQEHRARKNFMTDLMKQGEEVRELKQEINEIKGMLEVLLKKL